jgi:hypothetical protein
VLVRFGHTVPRIAPQLDEAYRHAQKNDLSDAAAIRDAISRPQMRSKDVLCTEKREWSSKMGRRFIECGAARLEPEHRSGIRFVVCSLSMGSVGQHLSHLRKMLPQLTEESETYLSGFAKGLFTPLYVELCALELPPG